MLSPVLQRNPLRGQCRRQSVSLARGSATCAGHDAIGGCRYGSSRLFLGWLVRGRAYAHASVAVHAPRLLVPWHACTMATRRGDSVGRGRFVPRRRSLAVRILVYIARCPQVSDTRRDIYCQASPGVWHEARVGQVSGTRREVDRRWARTDGPFRCREWEHGRTADALERPAAPAPAPATPPVASWPPHRQDERAAARGSASAPAWLV